MLILPKKDLILPHHLNVGIKGYLRLQTVNKFSGKIRIDTGWFPNLILDTGRNAMGTRSDFIDCAQVGTDNTAPNVGQAAMLGYQAGTTDIQSTLDGQQSSTPPYYGWKRRVYRFAAGTVAANLSEAGVGWATTGSTLYSRALILDPITQLPTTITPLADEALDLSYELRYYPPTVDVTSPSVTLDGITYDTTTRGAEVNSSNWSSSIGAEVGYASELNWNAYDGNIGTQLQNPSGSSAGPATPVMNNLVYSNNSYERVLTCQVDIDGWNLGAGIRSLRIRTTAGSFQTQFDANPGGATIPKTTGYTMIMKWKLAWTVL